MVIGVVVIGLIVAVYTLRGVIEGSPSASGPAVHSSTPSGSAGTSATPGSHASTPARNAPQITGASAIDPQGNDGQENNNLVPRAIDGDPATSWRTSTYGSAAFGGLKKGLGLVLVLGDGATLRQVTIDSPSDGARVELRIADGPAYDGSTLVASGQVAAGHLVLRPSKPVSTGFLVLWFTRLASDGRVVVSEIHVS